MADAVFVKTSSMYADCIVGIYDRNPWLKERPYAEQYAFITAKGFGWTTAWGKYLNAAGGYSTHEIIINAEFMQKQWAREHGCTFGEDTWITDIVTAQLCELKPDIWFAHDFSTINSQVRLKIRSLVPEIRLVIGWDGIALNSPESFQGCDLMLSCMADVSSFYEKHDFKSYTFYHCFDPVVLDRLTLNDGKYDVSFLGSVHLRDGGHTSRLKILGELAREVEIDFWVSGLLPKEGYWRYLRQQFKRLKRGKFEEFNNIRRIAARNRGEAFGMDMFQVLADSRITINTHIDSTGAKAGNMRLFEATGVGTCMITDWKENIGDFFIPDEEVVTFRSVPECVDKIRMLQKDDALRTRIARAGQKRTLEDHNFENRIRSFTGYLTGIGF